jgi:hypothetical protein
MHGGPPGNLPNETQKPLAVVRFYGNQGEYLGTRQLQITDRTEVRMQANQKYPPKYFPNPFKSVGRVSAVELHYVPLVYAYEDPDKHAGGVMRG